MKIILIATLTFLCLSCNEPATTTPSKQNNYVDFNNLNVGQLSVYAGFNYSDSTGKTYYDDTLTLCVVGKANESYYIAEYVDRLVLVDGIVRRLIDTVNYKMRFSGDTLCLLDSNNSPIAVSSRLFSGLYNKRFVIASDNYVDFNVDSLNPLYCERKTSTVMVGLIPEITYLGEKYYSPIVNIDNTYMAVDGAGITIVMDRQKGVLIQFSYSDWSIRKNNRGGGYELIVP